MTTPTPFRIEGVNAALLTARRPGEARMDLNATLDLLDFLAASGVRSIVLLGATGELVHFDLEERRRLVELAVRRSRVPVMASIAHSTLDGSLMLGRAAAAAGAAALLVMPPYFFRYRQADIKECLLRFAAELRGAAPILLYNLPCFTNELRAETAAELLATGLFAGIKDSSGRWENFIKLKSARRRHGFSLLVGNDVLFRPARAAGADGVISGCACAIPELMLALDRAIVNRDAERAELLDTRLHEFITWIDSFPAPFGIREAVAARGLKVGAHAIPLSAEEQRRLAEFREWFQGWLPAVLKECEHA